MSTPTRKRSLVGPSGSVKKKKYWMKDFQFLWPSSLDNHPMNLHFVKLCLVILWQNTTSHLLLLIILLSCVLNFFLSCEYCPDSQVLKKAKTACIYYNKGNAKRGVSSRLKVWPCDLDLWPWKSIEFQILLRTMYVPSLVKIHWKMLILECSQGWYAVTIWPLDLWPWKSIGFQTLLRTKYVPSLVKIHWMMLILVFTRMSHGKNLTLWPWPLTYDLENQ